MNHIVRTILAGLGAAAFALAPTLARADYARPYGPAAPWNVPVAGLPTSPDSAALVSALWCGAGCSTRTGALNLNVTTYNWSFPVYYAGNATGTCLVRTRYDWGSNIRGKYIPCNPNWKPSHGVNWPSGSDYDSQMIILDPATGREWNLWQYSYNATSRVVSISNGNLVSGSYWTKTDGFRGSRGAGIQYFAMLVMPEEVAEGRINHAMTLAAPSVDKSGSYVAPALKSDGDLYGISPGVPEGTRFALRVTDLEIQNWVNSLPLCVSPAGRASAAVLARAARDYGWFVTDYAGSTHTQLADVANPATKTAWANLGLNKQTCSNGKEYPRDLYDGLVTRERLYAIVPPSG